MTRIKTITLTVITESPVALSNDQGTGGNYTPVKKMFFKDGIHLFASTATFTYDLRRILHDEFGWKLFNIVLNKGTNEKVKNLYTAQLENENDEADLFGYLIPGESVSRVSPLRINPPVSIHPYRSDTQLITNRGFLNTTNGREYFDQDNKEIPLEDIPTAQALASEEIMGDFYQYTVTLELDRIGRIETQKVKKMKNKKELVSIEYLSPDKFGFKSPEVRKKIVTDLIEALKIFNRQIKHQSVFLEPLAVFGGAFTKVVPFFANSIVYKENHLQLANIKNTIDNYDLDKGKNLIKAVNSKIKTSAADDFEISDNPVGDLSKLITFINENVTINKDNQWIIKGDESNQA